MISSQNGSNPYVLSVYRPHESCRIAKYVDVIIDLKTYVAALQSHGVVIVIGDINSHFGSQWGPRGCGLTSRNRNIIRDFLRNNALTCDDLTELCTGPVYTYCKADLSKSYLDLCIISQSHGCLQLEISLVLMEYNNGNHDLARNPILVTVKVGLHLTKCIDYHQIKNVIIPIHFSTSSHSLAIYCALLFISIFTKIK